MEDPNPTSIVEPLKEMSTTDTKPSTENPNPTEESSTLKPSSVLESSTENPEKMEEELNPTSIVDPLKEMSITAAKPSTENPNPAEESSTLEPSSAAEFSTENPATMEENLNPISIVQQVKELSITNVKPSTENPKPTEESSVAESSTENPSLTDEASQETPEENFSFQVHPAIKLKQAIEALNEGWFNPEGLGLLEVDEYGLELTVRSPVSGADGHLWLDARGLINFRCNDMIKKWADLSHINDILADAADEDTMTIRRLRDSDELVFSFGNDPAKQFTTELFERDEVKYEKFPKISFVCEACILRCQLEEMIEAYEDPKNTKLIVADITVTGWDITVGKRDFVYECRVTNNGIRGLSGTQKHRAWFRWNDCEFLKKALVIAPGCLLCFTVQPRQSIMIRFNLRELGDLVYVFKSQLTILNVDDLDNTELSPDELQAAVALTEEIARI